MRSSLFKYLFVLVCLFSILESTGISVIKLIAKTTTTQTDATLADDDAAERSEREGNIKELLALEPSYLLPVVKLQVQSHRYPNEEFRPHLGWISPVPTPPPDLLA